MVSGYESGVVTKERLDEAVARMLSLKSALGLHKDRPLPAIETTRGHRLLGSSGVVVRQRDVCYRPGWFVKRVRNRFCEQFVSFLLAKILP
jgi:beta-N-acetylhexosaminidase